MNDDDVSESNVVPIDVSYLICGKRAQHIGVAKIKLKYNTTEYGISMKHKQIISVLGMAELSKLHPADLHSSNIMAI